MNTIICSIAVLAISLSVPAAAPLPDFPDGTVIACEGGYRDHIQGFDSDGESLYWSFASSLVKTDMDGKLETAIPVDYHCGDPCWADGLLYVPYGGGKWNQEIGEDVSKNYIRVYDADLKLVREYHIPDVVYGAGCIGYHDGRFFVSGGLPDGRQENYIYEYTPDFRLIKRHTLPIASHLGIQTIKFAAGSFWLGCYGQPNFCVRTDENFRIQATYDYATTVGLLYLNGDAERPRFLVAWHILDAETGLNHAKAVTVGVADGKMQVLR